MTKKKPLPEWEDLSPEEKKVYDDKVSNLVNIIEVILNEPDGFTILTGSNGGGKSLLRNQFGLKYQEDTERNPNKRKFYCWIFFYNSCNCLRNHKSFARTCWCFKNDSTTFSIFIG